MVPGSTPEDWRQHSNGGGWVYKTATVAESAVIAPTAIVFGKYAKIADYATIGNGATIADYANIGNGATIGIDAKIGDCAKIGDEATIADYAKIGDCAKIGNEAKIGDCAKIADYATIGNGATIADYANIGNDANIGNGTTIGNYAKIGDYAKIGPNTNWNTNPPQIQGSKHICTLYSLTEIAIGCQVHTIEHWQEHVLAIARQHGYTKEQGLEYQGHVEYLASIAARLRAVEVPA
jgi:carbonic anhydrase/acetyltransferase-like protein (isoleucine patch superfamily)